MKFNIKKKIKKGFSLIEIIIWISIASVLGGVVIIGSIPLIQTHKVNTANDELGTYSVGLLQYNNSYGSFPSQEEGLMALVNNNIIALPSKKKDFSDPNQIFTDPWNTPYVYTVDNDGQGYTLKSLGSDKKEGGNGNAKDLILSTGNQDQNEVKDFIPNKVIE